MDNFAVVILGPTCTGKTEIALDIAYKTGEIISVDSMQVYKYMDIGTAKPSKEELVKIKHHLIDIITPDRQFTAGEFNRSAQKLIPSINDSNMLPFLVGGTGLYFVSLIRGMVEMPKVDKDIKEYLLKKHEKIGQERAYKILKRVDYEYSQKIHNNDKQRTLRALEVILNTGKKFSGFLNKENVRPDFKYIIVGLKIDRSELYSRINNRIDAMIKKGLADEVKSLLEMGYNKHNPGLKAIGYKEFIEYFENKATFDKAVYNIKKNSRHYAKRQLTWFNKMDNINWFDCNDKKKIKDFINKEIEQLKIN